MNGRLAGKVALVTGASGGIGAAIAQRYADEGARVVGADVARPNAEAQSARVAHHQCDIADPAQVASLIESVVARYGGLDVAVNAAAVLGGSGPVETIPFEAWERYIRVNLTGAFIVAQAAARAMIVTRTKGSVILLGSVNSFAAEPEAVPYAASKGGVRMLTRALAVDLARHRIRVNMIAPGAIRVPRNEPIFDSLAVARTLGASIPAGGPGAPSDIVAAAVFLAEDENTYMTGAEIVLDGGLLARILAPVPEI